MARFDPSGAAGRFARAVTTTKWKDKAKHAAETLKAEYAAGKRGDDTPAAHIWSTPKEQLDGIMRLLRAERPVDHVAAEHGTDAASTEAPADVRTDQHPDQHSDQHVAEVAAAMRGVDWAGVRAATAERGGEVATAMRTMAAQVDWGKVQPVAAQVSSALIAAVASGRIGVGGPLGATVARTILGQPGVADRVARQLQHDDAPLPPDFRGAIEASAREA